MRYKKSTSLNNTLKMKKLKTKKRKIKNENEMINDKMIKIIKN